MNLLVLAIIFAVGLAFIGASSYYGKKARALYQHIEDLKANLTSGGKSDKMKKVG
jgi:hypothetical protein